MSAIDVRAIDENELSRAPRPPVRHELAVFMSEEAFDRAVERGASDTSREIGGVLVGEVLRDDQGPYVRIDTTIDALHADEKGAELTFTHATWEHIHKEMDTRHRGKRVVGWYHTHPGFGVFLSDRDQFIHKSFFDLPFQVAFVYDPKSREHGLFSWRDGEVWRLRRYAIGDRDHVWDGNRTESPPVDASEVRDKPDGEPRDEQGLGSILSLAIFGLTLVMIAGFLGHCVGAQSGNAAIRQVQAELVQARSEGAHQAIGALQDDLVGLLRDTLGDQAVHAPADQAIAQLDGAIAVLRLTGPFAGFPSPAVIQLQSTRESFLRLGRDRASAEATLSAIQRATRQGAELRTNLAHDVAEQRAAVGGLYAELAADAAKAGDVARARRLLATAAHLDPANRTRYATQLAPQGEKP